MPRSGVNGTYNLPPNTNNQAPNTPISSSMFNAFASDVQQTFNDPTPVAYGGTGQAELVLPSDEFGIKDGSNGTKRVDFDLSGIAASTTRTLTVPDKSGEILLDDGNLVWLSIPIGMPFPLFTNLVGVDEPPTDNTDFRFVKLTAGDVYNDTVLTNESVSGSAPLVVATADISDALSPMDGETVHLINTERRMIRAGMSGTVENDQMQQITGSIGTGGSAADGVLGANNNIPPDTLGAFSVSRIGGRGSDGTNRDALEINFDSGNSPDSRAGNETRAKNIGADYFMRIR